jgi:hypothetical protein
MKNLLGTVFDTFLIAFEKLDNTHRSYNRGNNDIRQ